MSKKNKRDTLSKLLKHWARATPDEQGRFLTLIDETFVDRGKKPTDSSVVDLIANGRYLLPETVKRIETIMISRGIGPTEVASELGFPGEGHTLTRALVKRCSLRLSIIAALNRWLSENEAGLS